MKLFVTGGTGFVGSHFLNAAHCAGHDIIALRRPSARPRVPLVREPVWVEGGLDGDHRAHLRGVDVFVHLAAHSTNAPYDSLERCLHWNVDVSVGLARQAIDSDVRRFLIAGTCFEYGRTADRVDHLSPSDPLEPVASYPTSKAAASIAFCGLARELALQLKVLRLFQVFGEGELETRLWPSLRRAALAGHDFPMSTGAQVRDFIHVGDAAERLVRALDFSGIVPGDPRTLHVATGQPQTLLEFAQTWWDRWEAKGKLIPGAVPHRATDVMRIASSLESLVP